MILLDTCALLWWTLDPNKLSPKASKVCSKIYHEGGFISSISIWEIGIKIKKKSINIDIRIEDYLHRLQKLGSLEIVSVDEEILVKNLSLSWENKDPCDRTIVATAMLKNLPILTKDTAIRDFYKNTIW